VPAVAEFFGVPKKGGSSLRVILERRLCNANVILELWGKREIDDEEYLFLCRPLTLPHPSQLADVLCLPGERLWLSSEDVAEFYHSLLWPACRHHKNAVGPLIRPSELAVLVTARRDELLALAMQDDSPKQLCLKSPGMGDQKASAVAQAFNQFALWRSGALTPSCWLSYGYPLPPSSLWLGSYIDDILSVLIARASASGFPEEDADLRAFELIREEHKHLGTQLHDAKRQVRVGRGVFWGAEVDSMACQVTGEVDSRKELCRLTLAAVVQAGSQVA